MQRLQRGFSLIELVVTMIILGVLALGVTGFITFGTQIYVDGQSWQQELGNVRYAAHRLTLELRQAIPGTLVSDSNNDNSVIEFVPIAYSERYLEAPKLSTPTTNNEKVLLAYKPGCADTATACKGLRLYLVEGYDAQSFVIDQVQCTGDLCDITLETVVPPGAYSIGQRYFIADRKVRWQLDGGTRCSAQIPIEGRNLCRQQDTYTAGGVSVGDEILMGEGVVNTGCSLSAKANLDQCPFFEQPVSLNRNNVVRLQWWVENAGLQQQFVQEVQLENVP